MGEVELPRQNPFAPGYGKRPPVFAGRTDIIEDFTDALDSRQHPSTSLLLIGPRGIGKTVTLDQLANIARSEGWRVIRTSAVQRDWRDALTEAIVSDHLDFVGADASRRVQGLQLFGLGVDFDLANRAGLENLRLRQALEVHAGALQEHGTGLALMIDEAQSSEIEDIRALGDDHQLVAESAELPIMLTMATLPQLEAELEADNRSATFLQRMDRRHLERLTETETLNAIAKPFRDEGLETSEEAAAAINRTVAGAPYFAQLLGFELWKHLRGQPAEVIEATHIEHAEQKAVATYGRTVVGALFNDLTVFERSFLMAMAVDDDNETDIQDVPARIKRDLNFSYQYRQKLITADVIYATRTRHIAFVDPAVREHIRTLPQFEEFLRKQGAP